MVNKPSRRQSLLLLGGVGAAAVAGGAVYEYEHDGAAGPYDPKLATPPPRPVAPPAPLPADDSVDWRPSAFGHQVADDVKLQMKGYASATSVNHGESIDFHASVTPAQSFTVQIFRLGKSPSGTASRLMTTSPAIDGTTQGVTVEAATRTVQAGWKASWTLDVPKDWPSGLYIATFTNENKYRNSVPFVVRADETPADLLVVLPFTTYQAYNMFPYDSKVGSSLYHAWDAKGVYGSTDICSTKVSFDRPYANNGLPSYFDLDLGFALWVEDQDYKVSYASSVDLHAGRVDHKKYKAMVFSGHDEYWSPEMRANLEKALADGTSAAFMAANNIYWNIRFEPGAGGAEHRHVVCYKGRQGEDPLRNQPGHVKTQMWRNNDNPEQRVLGAQYVSVVTDQKPQPLIVADAGHWFWQGTGVRQGEQIPNMIGGEADQVNRNLADSPKVEYLAVSQFTGNIGNNKTKRMPAHTVLRQLGSGAWVFDAGTFYWNYGLLSNAYVDSRIQKATKNLLDRMTGKVSA